MMALSGFLIGGRVPPSAAGSAPASLGFAAVGLLAAFRSDDLRLAAVLGPSIFMLGAAAGHLCQMVRAHNFAPGNAGIIFWTDIVIPLVGFALLRLSRRSARSRSALIAA